MKRTIFVLAMSLFLPATVNASDIDGNYQSYLDQRMGSCGQYVAARDEARRGNHHAANLYINWMAGYLTAYNIEKPDTYDIAGQTDREAMLLWLENHCKENPLRTFSSAMALLMNELHPERIRKAPK